MVLLCDDIDTLPPNACASMNNTHLLYLMYNNNNTDDKCN